MEIAERAGLNMIYSPHSLRHFKGNQTYKQYKDIKAVQGILRHRSIDSTQVYVTLDLDAKRDITKGLDDVE